jgi:hypothetical protein
MCNTPHIINLLDLSREEAEKYCIVIDEDDTIHCVECGAIVELTAIN